MSAVAAADPVAPARSYSQRMRALEHANHVRSHRAQFKQNVKDRRASVLLALSESDPLLDTMKVYDLLLAVPKFGRVKVQKLLARARISSAKTVGGLSPRQRQELLEMLRPYRVL